MDTTAQRVLINQRVLISGAAGFLGSHLSDALLAQGHTVVGVDNLCTGNMDNLQHLRGESRFSFVQQDISQPFGLSGVGDLGDFDLVMNFASPASPRDYHQLGIETLMVGSDGTRNMLEIARRSNARFVQASTSECYGDPLVHPQVETYWGHVNPIGERSVYDESKRFAEALTVAYRRYYSVNTGMVRIFNTYGPRLQKNDGRVISNLVIQALRGEELTIYGDGSQTRSFCFVSDLVDGILRLAASDEPLPVNIGNPIEWTILECAQEVLSVTGSTSRIVHQPLPSDDPTRRRPDITRAQTLLGWDPKIQLRQGLELSLEYFKACAAAKD